MEKTLFNRVEEALQDIRKFVQEDGGDLELVEITSENVAKVEMKGACTTCSMNNMTFKAGVEESIRNAVPEITSIEAINFNLQGASEK